MVKNEVAWRDLLRILRAAGHRCPVLVFSRIVKNTEFVVDFEQSGPTTSKKVVEGYIDGLAKRSETDASSWRKFNAV